MEELVSVAVVSQNCLESGLTAFLAGLCNFIFSFSFCVF